MMSLLREIQDLAVDSTIPVADLLKRCKILAVRMNNSEFQVWVDSELEGYRVKESVPTYRILNVASYGDFAGPLGSFLKNAPIPSMTIPKEFRENVNKIYIFDSVSSLEETLKSREHDYVRYSWPPNAVVNYGQKIYENSNCLSAWYVISRGSLAGIIDTVRTRVLIFSLALEKDNPASGESFDKQKEDPNGKIHQIIHNTFYGPVANLAQASSDFSQINLYVKQGDFNSLRQYLLKEGVQENDISELENVLKSDEKAKSPRIGKKTKTWIDKLLAKASTEAWKIGGTVAGNLLTVAISQYLGLPK